MNATPLTDILTYLVALLVLVVIGVVGVVADLIRRSRIPMEDEHRVLFFPTSYGLLALLVSATLWSIGFTRAGLMGLGLLVCSLLAWAFYQGRVRVTDEGVEQYRLGRQPRMIRWGEVDSIRHSLFRGANVVTGAGKRVLVDDDLQNLERFWRACRVHLPAELRPRHPSSTRS